MKKGILLVTMVLALAVPHKVLAAETDEFDYLTRCVEAEAGNQDLKGKRLIAAVILNRVEDERFPDTITDVINSPKQFAVVANGRIDEVEVNDETVKACKLEMKDRSDDKIIYFNNSSKVGGKYCYKYGKHYFGK